MRLLDIPYFIIDILKDTLAEQGGYDLNVIFPYFDIIFIFITCF